MSKFELFKLLTQDIFELKAKQSLIYAQKHNHSNCDAQDYMAFAGISLSSGHSKYPGQELCSSLESNFECALIREAKTKH